MGESGRPYFSANDLRQWKVEARGQNCRYILVIGERYTSANFPVYAVDVRELTTEKVKYELADEESLLMVRGVIDLINC